MKNIGSGLTRKSFLTEFLHSLHEHSICSFRINNFPNSHFLFEKGSVYKLIVLQGTQGYFSCNGDTCPQYLVDIPVGQTGADFTWQLRSGGTPTQNTGPNTDRSGSGLCFCLLKY